MSNYPQRHAWDGGCFIHFRMSYDSFC